MNIAIRLLVLAVAAASLQGCVVFTYGPGGLERVPDVAAPVDLAAALDAAEQHDERPARTAQNNK